MNQQLTVKDVATLFKVNPMTIYRWANTGKIPHERTPGGGLRFDDQELKKWLKSRTVEAKPLGQ